MVLLAGCLEEVPPRCFRCSFQVVLFLCSVTRNTRVPMVTGEKGAPRGDSGEKASHPNLLNLRTLPIALMKGLILRRVPSGLSIKLHRYHTRVVQICWQDMTMGAGTN